MQVEAPVGAGLDNTAQTLSDFKPIKTPEQGEGGSKKKGNEGSFKECCFSLGIFPN